MLPVVAFWSFWTNNTPIVAVMIPVLETWSVRSSLPLSHLLMPMSFAVILGGLVTVIGTSTTLVVQGLAQPLQLGFFDIAALGAPFTLLGGAFMVVFVPLLLKSGRGRGYVPPVFAWHRLRPSCRELGKTLLQCTFRTMPGVEILWMRAEQDARALFVPDLKSEISERDASLRVFNQPLHSGDMLLIVGVKECIEDVEGLEICSFDGTQLDGIAFFEFHLQSSYPEEPISVAAWNDLFNGRVRRIHRDGAILHTASGSVRDGIAKGRRGFFFFSPLFFVTSLPLEHSLCW